MGPGAFHSSQTPHFSFLHSIALWSYVDTFMHFVKPLLTIVGGLTPSYHPLPRRFPLNAVCDACEDDEETKEALTTYGMRVNEARSQDRQYNTRVITIAKTTAPKLRIV